MMILRTKSGAKYEVHEDDTFVRLSEMPILEERTDDPLPAPCGMYGTVIRRDVMEMEGGCIIGRCNCGCGATIRSTPIVEREER